MRLWPRKPKEVVSPLDVEAVEALRQAHRQLLDAERLDEAAQAVEQRLEATRERNHFAEAVIRSMRRHAS